MDTTLIQKAFQGNIIEELGLGPLPEEEKMSLIASLTDLIGTKTVLRITDTLVEADRNKFAEIMDSDKAEEVFPWLEARGIVFEEILLQEIAKVKEDLRVRARAIE
ncbi:MAG: hypothetical protein HYT39_02160 [Candidatus Sungbacteria bacterium]|nr:hypothetical protein [Candidatus Sungbacteria bacterium]